MGIIKIAENRFAYYGIKSTRYFCTFKSVQLILVANTKMISQNGSACIQVRVRTHNTHCRIDSDESYSFACS